MGIELIILTAHIFGNHFAHEIYYRPARQLQIQQQVYIQQQQENTQRILEAIEKVKK